MHQLKMSEHDESEEHTFTDFMRRYRYHTVSGLVQDYSFNFKIIYTINKLQSCRKLVQIFFI